MNELQVFVERVVRPIRGEESTKLKMRQELYAHALAAYEAEAQTASDERRAVASVLQRMGDAESLRRELQQTVSIPSQWAGALDQFVRRRAGESPLWHAARLSSAYSGVVTLLISCALLVRLNDLVHWTTNGQITARVAAAIAVLFLVNVFVFALLADGATALVSRKFSRQFDGLRAAGLSAAAFGQLVGTGWVFMLAVSGDVGAANAELWRWGALAALAPPALLVIAWLDVSARRDLSVWLALDVEGAG